MGLGLTHVMTAMATNMLRYPAVVVAASLLLFSCSERPAPAKPEPGETADSAGSFVNTVWRVSESSSIASDMLYVFLSEGTLVITSPHTKPALGRWKYEAGALTMVEEGIPYKVDVLKLGKKEFRSGAITLVSR